jgi:hypothetical protein
MFGIRPSALFRSRWMALGWAVLVCLSAVSFVASQGGGPETAGLDNAIDALP